MPTVIEDPLYLVMKGRFDALGVSRERGEIVDTSEWKNVRPLVDTRALSVVPIRIEDAISCPCGRRWVDEQSSLAHACPVRIQRAEALKRKAQAQVDAAKAKGSKVTA